jgi:hypothetical protein
MEDGKSAQPSAQETGIVGEFLQCVGGSFHQQAVDDLGMRAGQWAQFSGERERDQKVGTRQQMAALFLNPAIRLTLVTLRAGAVAAGMIREHFLLAVIALMDMASKERRAAGGNIPQSPLLDRTQRDAGLLTVRRAVEADNIGHLQHEDPSFRGLS